MISTIRTLATTGLVSAALALGGATAAMAQAGSQAENTSPGGLKRAASESVADLSAPELAAPQGVVRIMAAAVTADGTFATRRARDSDGVKSVAKLGTGIYEVIFRYRRLHVRCFYTANVADRDDGTLPPGYVNINARTGTNNGLWIETFDSSGANADLPFNVVVACSD